MKLARAASVFGLSALGCLVAGELLVRACVPDAEPVRVEEALAAPGSAGRVDTRRQIVQDPELFWRFAPSRVAPEDARVFRGRLSNAAGLREEHEIPTSKAPGELRVLFLGDSCTFGWGLLPEECYAQQVERLLAERLGRPVECINAGVPGWTLWQGAQAYEQLWSELRPDLVVVCFGWNDDTHWDGLTDSEHARLAAAERGPPGPLAASALCRFLWRALTPREAIHRDEKRTRVPPDEYAALIERLGEQARARGHGLLVLVWPARQNLGSDELTSYQEVLRGVSERGEGPEIDVLDLVPHAQRLGRTHAAALFQDVVHGTALLNRELAEPIAEWIADWSARAAAPSPPAGDGR